MDDSSSSLDNVPEFVHAGHIAGIRHVQPTAFFKQRLTTFHRTVSL